MSDKENNKNLTLQQEIKFWKDPRSMNVFNLFVQGKDLGGIAETLSMRPVTTQKIVTNKFFMSKLETHVRGILFNNQVAKVIASTQVFSKLWDRVMDNIEEIPPEICLKELTKMFPKKKEGMLINPKNMNVFMNVMKGDTSQQPTEIPGDPIDLSSDMGFEGLSEDDDSIYPELGEGQEEDGIKQGDPTVDPEESSKDQ